MSIATVFRLTRNGQALIEIALKLPERASDVWTVADDSNSRDVNELQPYGFEVGGRESDIEYRVSVGNKAIEVSGSPGGMVRGRGRDVVWDDGRHFDGARGRTWVCLESRHAGEDGYWVCRGRLPVHVRSSKLSDERYRIMASQIRRLAQGLLLDLVSPMLRSLATVAGPAGVSYRSGQEELRLIDNLWQSVSRPLLEIERDPVMRLTRAREPISFWSGGHLGARALAQLAARGVDPRHPATPRPFCVINERLRESVDTLEHRAIAGFLRFVQDRVAGCARDVQIHRKAIEADRDLRGRPIGNGPSLYDTEDRPRIDVLDKALERADRLGRSIRQARSLPLFRGLSSTLGFPSTPVFEHVQPYREIRDKFARYLRSSLLVLEDGMQERIKSMHRLYEQWVFFQLASAFRAAGLACVSQEGLFHRSHRYRYTLDVDRGARLTFMTPDSRAVVMRYEPWIYPRPVAIQRRESVYRGQTGESAWSPDVLIEFFDRPASSSPAGTVDYAVVVDAKYTDRLSNHQWNGVEKYLEIRATHNRRQVVKQVWIAFLDPRESTNFEDTDLSWPDSLSELPPDDSIRGRLGLLPPAETPDDDGEASRGWIPSPQTVARDFVEQLLRFRNIEPGDPNSNPYGL